MGHLRSTSHQDVEQDATPTRRRSGSVNRFIPSYSSPQGSDGLIRAPLLAIHPAKRRPPTAKQSRARISSMSSRRATKWLCIGITCILFAFAYSLVQMSRRSEFEVRSFLQVDRTMRANIHLRYRWLDRYFGGVRRLVPFEKNVPEYPRPEDVEEAGIKQEMERPIVSEDSAIGAAGIAQGSRSSSEDIRPEPLDPFSSEHKSTGPVECFLDDDDKVRVPSLYAYKGVPEGFPDPGYGSYGALGLRNDICFDRHGRLGPYGWGYRTDLGGIGIGIGGDHQGAEKVWENGQIDWRQVRWQKAQTRCYEKNKHRFAAPPPPSPRADGLSARDEKEDQSSSENRTVKLLPRHSVVVRTWHTRVWTQEDIVSMRALVGELAIATGGQYTVHFLIHVKDDNILVWSDPVLYDEIMRKSLPEEFQGMGTLWSERQMFLLHGDVGPLLRDRPVHGVYRGLLLPFQWFAHNHPEYDFFWHMEMDVRFLGHYYHFFDTVGTWAKKQARKDLWERNSRFYFPSLHGNYSDFIKVVRQGIEAEEDRTDLLKQLGRPSVRTAEQQPIWGARKFPGSETLNLTDAPIPPHSFEHDEYEWGVGEDADLIGFDPMFDPEGTGWGWRDDVVGYDHQKPLPPRRTQIVTNGRYSRRLIDTMYYEVVRQRHSMFTEMWPASCALHHGYKAVFVPHPVYLDKAWNVNVFGALLNSGRGGSSGGSEKSPFGSNEGIFWGTTFYYHARFAQRLWMAWLGFKVPGFGGEAQELLVGGEGRMCLRQMWLHPIKHVGQDHAVPD